MKCTGISVGNEHPKDKQTMEQFVVSRQAETLLGKLLITLTKETAWSAKYEVYASFSERPFLNIRHPVFLPEQSLMIYDDAKTVLSVRGVEDAVRTLISNSRSALLSSISLLQYRRDYLERELDQIMWDKALAAIVAVFPEASGATPSSVGTQRDLYAFSTNEKAECLFVARQIDCEFVGGTACINCDSFRWYRASNGVEKNSRHYLFWAALARAFAARELNIPETDLWCENVSTSENPLEFPQPDPYIVEKVIFSCRNREIVVEFGSDNLPETVTVLPATQEESVTST